LLVCLFACLFVLFVSLDWRFMVLEELLHSIYSTLLYSLPFSTHFYFRKR
jgi:hypothetical protein